MKNKEQHKQPVFAGVGNPLKRFPIFEWIITYKWHVLFWIGYFFYAYLTDKLTYGKYIYLSKEVILVATHPLYLFYSLLFCFNSFEKQTPLRLARGILFFVIAIALFWLMRVVTNYYLYPVMDVARGLEKERLVTKDFVINGVFWVTEFLIKAAFFFYVVKYVRKERQFRVVLSEKLAHEQALTEKRIEQELALQRQKEYEQRETMFINLVHETKTPITLITNGIADYIDQNGSSPALEGIRRSVNKLSRDITNLFDLERFRHGVEMFNHDQWIDFSTLLKTAYDSFAPYCQKKGIQLSQNIKEGVMISADSAALTRIINNLVENAIKYSPAGTEISLLLSSERGVVSFAVCDQGQGIAEEDLETIFIPYHLLNKKKKNFQGMGLGLPMVNNIVESLNGEISVTNNEFGGTTVTVLLPVGEKVELTQMGEPEPYMNVIEEREPIHDTIINEESPVVLVIEDNHDVNGYLVRKLAQKFNVRSALNGNEALTKIKVEAPDLIISDVMMDEMDGFEFAKIIKETPSLSHIPIIFLTAKATEVDKMKGLALGAIDYVVKPFGMDELLKKVESLLSYTDRQQRRLYDDMYRAIKMLKRKGDHTDADEMTPKVEEGAFLLRCQNFELTKREMEITQLLLAGKTNKWIADSIFISPRTVETHISNIYEKLKVSNKLELIKVFR